MIGTVYIFVVFFTSIWLQAFIGYFGLIVPVSALSVVYITIICGWRTGVIYSMATGVVTGLLYGDFISGFRMFNMILISFFAVVWLYKGDVKSSLLQMIPGAVASFIYAFPVVYECYAEIESGFYLLMKNMLLLAAAAIAGGLIFPVYVRVLDSLNNKLKLNRYSKAKEILLKES